jgi:hypothetical protein
MPLHVDIRINDTLINQIHIARTKGGTRADDVNEYVVVDGPKPTRYEDWLIDGITFQHRYGDGAEICVMKGIQAMKSYCQDCKNGSCEPHYIPPKTYIVEGEQK